MNYLSQHLKGLKLRRFSLSHFSENSFCRYAEFHRHTTMCFGYQLSFITATIPQIIKKNIFSRKVVLRACTIWQSLTFFMEAAVLSRLLIISIRRQTQSKHTHTKICFNYHLNAQFLYSIIIYILHYDPRHVYLIVFNNTADPILVT